MAHFAELDENNIVLRVIVIHNNELLDDNKIEIEDNGIKFCQSIFGKNTQWVQTSYNNSFRKVFARIGMQYSPTLDEFIDYSPTL